MDRLVLEVFGRGRAAWRVHYDLVTGRLRRRRKLKIGDASTPISTVRERWHAAIGVIEKGGDPVGDIATRRLVDAQRSEMTFSRLVAEFLSAKVQAGLRSLNEVRRILEKDCVPILGKRPVADIHELELEAIIERIAVRGAPVQARATHVHLQSIFEWALGTARWRAAGLASNPARLIKKPKPPAPRTRKLSNLEIREFWAALEQADGIEAGTAAAFLLTLLLGRRSGEILALPWCELELDRPDPLWRLPPTRSKNRREVIIPLSAPAIALLRDRRLENDALPQPHAFVFPGVGGKPLTEGVLRTALRRMFESGRLAPPRFSVHDIRRTVAHRCSEELDFSQEIIAAFLGHKANGVTDEHYSQASKLNRTRRLTEAWATHLMDIIAGGAGSNVVSLRSRGAH
jgi:integrase